MATSFCVKALVIKYRLLRLSTYLALKSNMTTSFRVKVPVLKYKTKCEGSSTFGEGLQHLPECHNNESCIYQSMCAFIEQMVNLSQSKKSLDHIHNKVYLKRKNTKKSIIRFFISKPDTAWVIVTLQPQRH